MQDAHILEICPQCGQDLSTSQDLILDGQPSFCQSCRFPVVKIAGKYRVDKELGEGGFATVYLARHIHLTEDAERVIKFIKPEVISHPGIKERFYREVQVTSTLSARNEHIVRIYDDFGEHPQLGHYYVMEYLQGPSLVEWTKQFPQNLPPLTACLNIFGQLCDAMGSAHRADVIHRDLKPDNLMLVSREKEANFLKVLDFGIAKPVSAAERTSSRLTQGLLGSPMYMAPEQCTNKQIDARADIYAMGCLLYLLLTGQTPFARLLDERGPMGIMQILQAHIMESPPLAGDLEAERVGAATEALLQSALAKDPDDRPQSVDAFFDSLTSAMEQDGLIKTQARTPAPEDANVTAAYFAPIPKQAPLASSESLDSAPSISVPTETGGTTQRPNTPSATAAFVRQDHPVPQTPTNATPQLPTVEPDVPGAREMASGPPSSARSEADFAPTDPSVPFHLDEDAIAKAVQASDSAASRAKARGAAATVHDMGSSKAAPVPLAQPEGPKRTWAWLLLVMLPVGVVLGIVVAQVVGKTKRVTTRPPLLPITTHVPRPRPHVPARTRIGAPPPKRIARLTPPTPRRHRKKQKHRKRRTKRRRPRHRSAQPRHVSTRKCAANANGTTWLALHTRPAKLHIRIEGNAQKRHPKSGLACIGLRGSVTVHFQQKGHTPCIVVLSLTHGAQRHFNVRLTKKSGIEFNEPSYCFKAR